MKQNSVSERLVNGLIKENPTFVLMLGMCPTLAVTSSAINGLGMGLSTMVVLICSNLLISLFRKIIPNGVRIPAYIVIVASLVTVVQLLMQAYMQDLSKALGVYIPLIVVNCIILGRAEMFANKNTVINSAIDGLGMGIGFTLALFLMATIREVLGSGSWLGFSIPVLSDNNISIMTMAPGGFLVFGILIAVVNTVTKKKNPKTEFGCAGCPSAEICGKAKSGEVEK